MSEKEHSKGLGGLAYCHLILLIQGAIRKTGETQDFDFFPNPLFKTWNYAFLEGGKD